MTLEEAKNLMSESSLEKLRSVVAQHVDIDVSKKVNNDLIMTALCTAVVLDGKIKPESIDDRLLKLLNSDTNTISDSKLSDIMHSIHETQRYITCIVTLMNNEFEKINEWILYEDFRFNEIFEFILNYYKITPQLIRSQMITTLKPTIVNNIGQLVSKYQQSTPEEKQKIHISITTINRLVTMSGGILNVTFDNAFHSKVK